jgi:uncharacterized SAM-binding protein YcdF (DUF218 family)
MLLRIKTFLKVLILPPSGPLLLAALGFLLLRRHARLGRACIALGLGSLWLMSLPLIADALTRAAEHYPPLNWQDAASAQAIVILGGGGQREFAQEYGGPAAEPVLLERLNYGAYVAHKTALPVLVTGFRIEAQAMHDSLLRNFDITPRWVDAAAYDTFENARNSAALLKADHIRRIVLVTHATHLRRAAQEFAAAGLDVVPAPVGLAPPADFRLMAWVPNPEALMHS